jgi:sulfane dehydrogenase subunit SoxC
MTTRPFVECSGNATAPSRRSACSSPREFGNIARSEWTGVPLRVLLEAGLLRAGAARRGADSAHEPQHPGRRLDDALVALYQNGEHLRPEQGYPVRLLLPGWEGNI